MWRSWVGLLLSLTFCPLVGGAPAEGLNSPLHGISNNDEHEPSRREDKPSGRSMIRLRRPEHPPPTSRPPHGTPVVSKFISSEEKQYIFATSDSATPSINATFTRCGALHGPTMVPQGPDKFFPTSRYFGSREPPPPRPPPPLPPP
eukprot:CAMPEP_0119517888 /NCGR_PEP_ID=MMETSP1344-20130328/34660_1 /TAXON_ID=236787 /ORGANISM="Florenciella parvula, Strain CCMP2471" /LENGTH=145 /DNA_ID=CAMNT_0007555527 /DNA_START=226 /DNA_END=659 /DNA_ORIENTATION=+